MKATSKSNGTRLQRGARSNAAVRAAAKGKKEWTDPFEDPMAESGWKALEEEIDLHDFDLDGIDDGESASGDWLADHALAQEIAQRALH